MKIISALIQSFLLLFCFSCISQEENVEKESKKIVNVILKKYDSVLLVKETYYLEDSITNIIESYLKLYDKNLIKQPDSIKKKNIAYKAFYKDIDGVITKSELKEMKRKYHFWSIKKWTETDIKNKKVKLTTLNEIKINKNEIVFIRLSEPLFTKDMKKAIIKKRYYKNGSGGESIQILIKKDGKWIVKGGFLLKMTVT